MKACLLAGGFATRLWPLTEHRAKPLLLLDGKTIVEHILDQIPPEVEVLLLTNSKFEAAFQKVIAQRKQKNVTIFCEDAYADGEKLGALRALSVALKHYNVVDDIVVLAGDNLLPDLDIEQIFCSDKQACIAVRSVKDFHEARKFGVVETEKTQGRLRVKTFLEKPEQPPSTLVSTGFMGLGAATLPLLHACAESAPDALGGLFSYLLDQGVPVWAEKITGEWFDVGSFETYLEAHKALQKTPLALGDHVTEINNTFSGKVFVGEGSHIEGCQILDSIIYGNVTLKNCHLSQVVLDEGCCLEGVDLNHKLVRRGTILQGHTASSVAV